MNSLDFIGHVILTVSPPLNPEESNDEEKEDEAHHWADGGAGYHPRFSG